MIAPKTPSDEAVADRPVADCPAGDRTVTDCPAGDGEKRAPGRPRSARCDAAIVDAVLSMLADGTSVEALSMDAVATRAGVGKATIYRRWASKEALIMDALAVLKRPLPPMAGRSVREDLVRLLSTVLSPADSRSGRILPALIPLLQQNDEFYRVYQSLIEPRREVGREILRRGIARGELRPDLDLETVLAMMTAPLLMQGILRWNPQLDATELPERIVDVILAGIGAVPPRVSVPSDPPPHR